MRDYDTAVVWVKYARRNLCDIFATSRNSHKLGPRIKKPLYVFLQDATVRELYDKVRQDLKENWKLTGAFQLSIDVTDSLEKDDSKIKAVGLCNGMTLFAAALSEPYSWDLFVKLPGRPTATIVTLYEV